MNSDIKLLLKLVADNDNQQAFEKIFSLYFPKSYGTALYFIKSKETAEEIVSDVFIQIWKVRRKLSEVNNWESYLYVMIKNHALKHLKNQTNNDISIDLFTVQYESEDDSPEEILVKKEFKSILSEAVDNLPERCKMIYLMVREERMTYAQVAEILDISERTVNTQMTIATKKLIGTLREYLET